jgi:hypothetical protein
MGSIFSKKRLDIPIINKHLLNIINEYINNPIPFRNELLNETRDILKHSTYWITYLNHVIKYSNIVISEDSIFSRYNKGYTLTVQIKIYRRYNGWRVFWL